MSDTLAGEEIILKGRKVQVGMFPIVTLGVTPAGLLVPNRVAANGAPLSLAGSYETVAASQTGQVLGATGATGDYIGSVTVIPASTSPGAIALLDGVTSITIFAGGANSVADLKAFTIPLGLTSVNGAFSITTGANVSVIASGSFT